MCTVKPSSDYRYCDTQAKGRTEYAEIDLDSLKAKDDDDDDVSKNGGVDSDKPQTDPRSPMKRHSLPSVLPDSLLEAAAQGNKQDTLNYLELNFPRDERPRNKSDVSRSPRLPPRMNKPPGKPAYIELDFDSKDSQVPSVERDSTVAGAGDRKSQSLPRR